MSGSGPGRFRTRLVPGSDHEVQDASKDIEKENHKDPYQLVTSLKVTPNDIDQGNQGEQDSDGGQDYDEKNLPGTN